MIAGIDSDVIDVRKKALTRWLQVESKLIMIACTKKVKSMFQRKKTLTLKSYR